MKILCFIQSEDSSINGVSKEALSLSQELCEKNNGNLTVLTFDNSASNELSNFSSDKLILGESPDLKDYNPLFYTSAVEKLIKEHSFDLIVLGHTYQARDWVPRLSARCDIPFISDCIDYSSEGSSIEWIRSLYRAKINCKIKANSSQSIISVQSGCFSSEALKSGNCSVSKVDLDLSDVKKTIIPGEKFKESGSQVDLNSSDVIVSIGRGIAKKKISQWLLNLLRF